MILNTNLLLCLHLVGLVIVTHGSSVVRELRVVEHESVPLLLPEPSLSAAQDGRLVEPLALGGARLPLLVATPLSLVVAAILLVLLLTSNS